MAKKDTTDIKELSEETVNRKKGVRYDPELYKLILKAYKSSKEFIEERGIYKDAEKYTRMYEGDSWKALGIRRAMHLSKIKTSIAFDIIETKLAVVTARTPAPTIELELPPEDQLYKQVKETFMAAETQENSEALEEVTKAIVAFKEKTKKYTKGLQRQLIKHCKESKMQRKMRMAYREKKKVGICGIRSVYDSEKNDIIDEIIDITTIFPAPGISNIDDHAEDIFCYVVPMSKSKIKRKYGIEEISKEAEGNYDNMSQLEGTERGFSAVIKKMFERKNKEGGDYCKVIEAYMPDDGTVEDAIQEIYERDEEGKTVFDDGNNPVVKEEVIVKRPKFPSGYKRVTIIEDHKNWIIEESDNPYKRPPFFFMINYPQAKEFWGISEIKNVEDLIMRINYMASNVHDNIRYTGNPILLKTHDTRLAGTAKEDNIEITNEIGQVLETSDPNAVRFVQPPTTGYDIKWFIDWLMRMIDRITHLSDAIRGFNEFAKDSGRKIQELRQAAMGTFRPELDEQVEIYTDLYEHWSYIYQNLYQGSVLQIDDYDSTRFDEFNPNEGRRFKLHIDVSTKNLLPEDPYAEFDEAIALFDRGTERIGVPLISPEQLIELAPTLEDKARALKYYQEERQKHDRAEQLEKQVIEKFEDIIEATVDFTEGKGVEKLDEQQIAEGEGQAMEDIYGIVSQYPELLLSDRFQAIPYRIRVAVIGKMAGVDQEGIQQYQQQKFEER